jgi:hypothetical protein
MNGAEQQVFAHSGWLNRAAWYYWNEELVGSVGVFLYLVGTGVVLGLIGGLVGWGSSQAARRRSP